MIKKRFITDILSTAASNLLVVISGLFSGFIIPKMLGVTQYGHYKLFSLYDSYAPLLHLGFVDGVLLLLAGKSYVDLKKSKIRSYTFFFFLMECVISLLLIMIGIFAFDNYLKLLLIFLSLDILALNITSYYQAISQGTMRFKELSIRKILLSILKIILVVFLILIYHFKIVPSVTANMYIFGLVAIDISLTFWYVYTYRDLTFGERVPLVTITSELVQLFKNGFVLTISFQVANVIGLLDQQFISIFFSNRAYSLYAFAYNIISLGLTVIGAVSLVLLPTLRKLDVKKIVQNFSQSLSYMTIIASLLLSGYFVIKIIIIKVLPIYNESLEILSVSFPCLLLISCIDIIIFTYYKALNKHKYYFMLSCFVLVVSIAVDYFTCILFKSTVAMAAATVIIMTFWYLISEMYFVFVHKVRWLKNFIYLIMSMCIFYVIEYLNYNYFMSFMIYLSVQCLVIFCFYRHELKLLKHK